MVDKILTGLKKIVVTENEFIKNSQIITFSSLTVLIVLSELAYIKRLTLTTTGLE